MREDESATKAVEEMFRRPDVAQRVMSSPSNQRILYRAQHEQRQQAAAARFAAAHERDETGNEVEEVRQIRRREPAADYQGASSEALELIGSGTPTLRRFSEPTQPPTRSVNCTAPGQEHDDTTSHCRPAAFTARRRLRLTAQVANGGRSA